MESTLSCSLDFDKIPPAMQTAQDVKGTVNTGGAAAKAKPIKFDIAQTREFLAALYGDYFSKNKGHFLEVRHKGRGEREEMQRSFYPDPAALLKAMPRWKADRHYWIAPNPRSNNKGGTKEDVAAILAFYGDMDCGTEGHNKPSPYPNKGEAQAALEQCPLEPSILVDTGGGLQPHWLLKEPIRPENGNLDRFERILRGVGTAIKSDPMNAAGILRLPGPCNVKIEDNPRPVKMLYCHPERTYTLNELEQWAKPFMEQEQAPRPGNGHGSRLPGHEAYAQAALTAELTKLARAPQQGQGRNIQLNQSAYALGQLIGAGVLDQGSAEAGLYGVAASIGLSDKEIRGTIRSGIEAGIKEPRQLPERERPRSAHEDKDRPEEGGCSESEHDHKTIIAEQICDVSTFISLALPEKRKILKPWLSESTINMIYGPRGIGKTSLAMGIITAATTGKAFWQWEVESPVPGLYLDGEMAAVDVQQRFAQIEALKTPGRQPLIIYCDAQMVQLGLPRANLLNKKWREQMKQLLLENEVKLWVADNIASLAPGIDENSKQDWDPLNQWFLDLRFHGISTIFLHHSGKDGTQRGTSGREDNLDISISLDFPQGYTREDGCRFVCKFVKTRIPHADLPLVTDTEMWWRPDENGIYTWVFQSVRKQHKVEVVKKLDEGKSQKDIAAELGITPARVSQLKKEAVQDGLITEAGNLTQTGFEWLQKT